jgi:predicted nuclease with TOPRIM domain
MRRLAVASSQEPCEDRFVRGSEWRKWDLHTHTPASILNNKFPHLPDGTPDWERYVTALEATDIAVLGVTDYFTIDGYKKLREFKSNGRLANIACLLPNIEFRLDKTISSRHDREPRRLNFHVIFSDELAPETIEEHFLHDLDFDYEGNPQSPSGTRKLKISNIKDLGERLARENKAFAGDDPLQLGASKIVVSTDRIRKALGDDRFKGRYLIVLSEELSSLIDWDGQDHLVRKLLLQCSDMVFSSNPKNREWCLGREPYLEGGAKFIEEFKSLKPCIHGSDAHELSAIDRPCAKRFGAHNCATNSNECDMRYLWVKADPTFEGLKQLVCEPDDRVRIQAENPAPMRGGYTIDSFSIGHTRVSDELTVLRDERALNAGLVAVCGGRGAGKTAYVDLLANCFVDRAMSGDPNSFVQRVKDPGMSIATEIGFRNGESFKKDSSDGRFFENSDVVYIAQGQLERYIGEGSSLEKYVNDLVFASPPIHNSVLEYDFDRLQVSISESESALISSCNSIGVLENATAQPRREELRVSLNRAKAEAEDLHQQAATLEKRIGIEKVQLAETQQKAIAELSAKRAKYEELQKLLVDARTYVKGELPRANDLIRRANALIREVGLGDDICEISFSEEGSLKKHIDAIGPMIVGVVRELAQAQAKLEGYATDVKEHAKLLERGRAADESVKTLETKTAAMSASIVKLKEERARRTEEFKSLIEGVMKQRDKYSEIIAAFAYQRAEILADLDFIPEVAFDASGLVSRLGEVIDNRKAKIGIGEDDSAIVELLKCYRMTVGGDSGAIEDLVSEVDKQADALGQQLRASYVVDHSAFYRILYQNYLRVVPVVKYKGVGLNKLSLGQKATVLMKIYLAEGTKPIIIDSHDDHLDNQYIMDELIRAIREAKKIRQVMLVSNNANVVINSDAEQIIVAQHEGGEITYTSGSIENESIREMALSVLEGGPDAFQKRQKKYRMGA